MNLRERLAKLCHIQWSGWMQYLFSKGTSNDNGTWTMPSWAVERWTRQMNMSYDELSEKEKDSDRDEADRFLEIIGKRIAEFIFDRNGLSAIVLEDGLKIELSASDYDNIVFIDIINE